MWAIKKRKKKKKKKKRQVQITPTRYNKSEAHNPIV